MTPERTVILLTELLAADAPADEEALVAPLVEAGVPEGEAERAIRFTQIAWGRALLEALDLSLAPRYLCLGAEGEVLEEGRLADEPYYAAAAHEAGQHRQQDYFARFASTAADVQAVYGALREGSEPRSLTIGPSVVFLEPPTEEGLARAQDELARRTPEEATATKKPWWRPW